MMMINNDNSLYLLIVVKFDRDQKKTLSTQLIKSIDYFLINLKLYKY
jgi:hypothetical protein